MEKPENRIQTSCRGWSEWQWCGGVDNIPEVYPEETAFPGPLYKRGNGRRVFPGSGEMMFFTSSLSVRLHRYNL